MKLVSRLVVFSLLFYQLQLQGQVRFAVVSDMQFAVGGIYNKEDYFLGVCQAIQFFDVQFIISAGDNCPADLVDETIRSIFGAEFLWYPCIGNHEMEAQVYRDQAVALIRRLPGIETGFKETVYSFDIGAVHFSVLDLYQVNNDADIYDRLYDWLRDDLQATQQPVKLVIGHEPAFVLPDRDCGRIREVGRCLDEHRDNRDRFWDLLRQFGVAAYFCGHTHNFSYRNFDGVWQVNVGHSRGAMEPEAPSTFLVVETHGARGMAQGGVTVTAYRDIHDGVYDYRDIVHRFEIGLGGDREAPGAPGNLRVKGF